MLKKFLVKVNGKPYNVEVEDLGSENVVHSAPVAAPAPVHAAPAPVAAPATPTPAPTPKPAAPVAPGAGHQVLAPLPGVLVDVCVSVGQTVHLKDKLVVIEAMKMENEIPSEVEGIVQQVLVSKGDTVDADQVLIVIA